MGLNVALGTDGASSNDNQNMWEVVKLSSILHRFMDGKDWITAERALRTCFEAGRRPLARLWALSSGNVGRPGDFETLGCWPCRRTR